MIDSDPWRASVEDTRPAAVSAGTPVRLAMRAQRWSAVSLAAQIGMCRHTITRVLRGRPIKGESAAKIAAELFPEALRPAMIAAMTTAKPLTTEKDATHD